MSPQYRLDEEPDIEVLVELPETDDRADEVVDAFDDPRDVAARRAAARAEVSVGGLSDLEGKDAEVSEDAAAVAVAVRRQLGHGGSEDEDTEVRPRGADEVTCMGCFLIVHVSRIADPTTTLCNDCA